MSKRKVRECKHKDGYPAAYGRQFCTWHCLMRLSSEEQADAARARFLASQRREEPWRARVPQVEWPLGERWCSDCQDYVPLFYTSGSKCKAHASMAAHAKRVEDNYGITAEDYQSLLGRQNGRCAICGNRSRTIRLAVDHNHQTGEVRGLLCKRCNHDLLGSGYDDPTQLWRAIRYLVEPPARKSVEGERMTDLEVLQFVQSMNSMKLMRFKNPEQPQELNDPPPF